MKDIEPFFEGQPIARKLFESVRELIARLGPSEIQVTKSQITFRQKRGFAWVWMPGQYLHRQTAPLVLSLALNRHDNSLPWKQVVEPYPGRFMHHLELFSAEDLGERLLPLLAEARDLASQKR